MKLYYVSLTFRYTKKKNMKNFEAPSIVEDGGGARLTLIFPCNSQVTHLIY